MYNEPNCSTSKTILPYINTLTNNLHMKLTDKNGYGGFWKISRISLIHVTVLCCFFPKRFYGKLLPLVKLPAFLQYSVSGFIYFFKSENSPIWCIQSNLFKIIYGLNINPIGLVLNYQYLPINWQTVCVYKRASAQWSPIWVKHHHICCPGMRMLLNLTLNKKMYAGIR